MVLAVEERMLTPKEVAEYLRVSEWTVLNWLRSKRLKGVRLGGTRAGWRVAESDVKQFIAELRGDQD